MMDEIEDVKRERVTKPLNTRNFISWLDGCDATFWATRYDPETDERIFEFKPNELMQWMHQIQEHEYNPETGTIVKRYPEDLCLNATVLTNRTRWFIWCDFNGKETMAMRKMDIELLQKNKALITEVNILRMRLLKSEKERLKSELHRDEADVQKFESMKKIYNTFGEQDDGTKK